MKRKATIKIPTIPEMLDLALPPALEKLRNRALDVQNSAEIRDTGFAGGATMGLPMNQAMADAWALHTEDEDWQIWRARRFAARITHMEVELEPGEPIVGKTLLRVLDDNEQAEVDRVLEELGDANAYPGGDIGHFHPNYEKVLKLGVGGMLEQICELRKRNRDNVEKTVFYDACRIAMTAFRQYILQVAGACRNMAGECPEEAGHWQNQARICTRLADNPPATFHEACQLMYFVFIASWAGEDHVMTCFDRMDRTLGSFYDADIADGRITPQAALHLICAMYIQINRICRPNLADAVIVGGRDGSGIDVTNTVSYLCLAARQATWLVFPTVAVAWHRETPSELMNFAVEMLASGINDPAFFNEETIAAGLQAHGCTVEDARNFMNSTCVEIQPAATSNVWIATEYVNCCAHLLDIMRREAEDELPVAGNFEALQQRVRESITAQVKETAVRLNETWRKREQIGCFPFASCLIDDCLERGLDHDRGGARYNWAENSYVGLANLTDALAAIDELVYRRGEMDLKELYEICREDFAGQEDLRRRIVNCFPKYGNDDERADALAVAWGSFLVEMTESFSVAGHRYVPGFFCHMNHMWLGEKTGATPDGRRAGIPFADGAGAVQGAERNGPTAAVLSTTKWNHTKALGGIVQNLRFSHKTMASEVGRVAVRKVIETYLYRGGFEVQVNVVSAATLAEARRKPEEYRDLVVRVAGYSDYFTTMAPALQDEVIARTQFEV